MKPKHLYIAGSLQTAWQQKDFDLLYSVIAENVEWYETPFDDPLLSPDEIIGQWQKDLFDQHEINADIRLLDCVDERGYYHFGASWTNNAGERYTLDGVFEILIDEEGSITRFRQWWIAE